MTKTIWKLACCLMVAATAERAVAATFTVDSAASVITAAPTYLASSLGEQLPGSLSAHVQGTLEAVLLPDAILFPGGSNLDFIAQPGPFNPGGAPADFAASSLFTQATLRNGAFSLSGGSRPIVANSFEASTIASFLAGLIEVASISGPGSADLAFLSFNSSPATAGSIVPLGTLLELHVPVDGTLNLGDVNVHFTGQIVGTISIPEPSSGALVAIASGLMAVFLTVRRQAVRCPGSEQSQ